MDDYKTFDNDNKRVRRKKKQSKDARNIAIYNDKVENRVISQAFQVNDKLGMSKLSISNQAPLPKKKFNSNPNSTLEGASINPQKIKNMRITEKPISENYEDYGSPMSQSPQPDDYEVNYSDGNTGATKETFKVSKKQL